MSYVSHYQYVSHDYSKALKTKGTLKH